MSFPTKIAIVVREDLATWQKLNVACFLAGGLVGLSPELAGEYMGRSSGSRSWSSQDQPRILRQPLSEPLPWG
jgi:hypothetical protein